MLAIFTGYYLFSVFGKLLRLIPSKETIGGNRAYSFIDRISPLVLVPGGEGELLGFCGPVESVLGTQARGQHSLGGCSGGHGGVLGSAPCSMGGARMLEHLGAFYCYYFDCYNYVAWVLAWRIGVCRIFGMWRRGFVLNRWVSE